MGGPRVNVVVVAVVVVVVVVVVPQIGTWQFRSTTFPTLAQLPSCRNTTSTAQSRRGFVVQLFGEELTTPQYKSENINVTRVSWSVLLNKYYSGDQVKEDVTGEACGTYEKSYRLMAGKPEEMRASERPNPRWKDIFEIKIKEIWGAGRGLECLAQYRNKWQQLANILTSLRVPENAGNFLIRWVLTFQG
jgi:hypothetical protein